jgi:hypothetical protein
MKSPLKTTFDWLYALGFTFMSYIVARFDSRMLASTF